MSEMSGPEKPLQEPTLPELRQAMAQRLLDLADDWKNNRGGDENIWKLIQNELGDVVEDGEAETQFNAGIELMKNNGLIDEPALKQIEQESRDFLRF